MAEKNISVADIAEAINRKPETTRKKLAGINPFDLNEAMGIQEKVFPEIPFKILFSTKAAIEKAAV
ncbi:hypothetical protein UNSWDHB_2651 [Dehalobacter sp. UNSWDHB]|nr:hypothetical protein UNSWDHB_2651 [Dehalobacter sp. UNSWDHB]